MALSTIAGVIKQRKQFQSPPRAPRQGRCVPQKFRDCFRKVFEGAGDPQSTEFVQLCFEQLCKCFSYDKKHYVCQYKAAFHELAVLLPGQVEPMLLSRMHEVDRLIEQQAGLDAMLGWENNVAAITGLSKTAADTWGVCYVPVAVQPDGEALHISHCMEGWSLQMIARAVFMATAALLYDACLADGPDTLSKLASGIMSAVDPDQTPMGCGVQVAPANNVRCNWLPFTLAEASHLAFGDRVSVDALPAVLCALRMQQPDFNLPLHTEAVVLA